jgi:predicted glycogen debranching enzyme
MAPVSDSAEWLEVGGLGGFASGTTAGIRTRRYHALLLTATTPPADRKVLVNGFEAWVQTVLGNWFLTSQRYLPDIVYPDGITRIKTFEHRPWPTWLFELDDNLGIEQELFVPYGQSALVSIWRLTGNPGHNVKLAVRPFLSGRDFHGMHRENSSFRFDPELSRDRVRWKPYYDIPAVLARSSGRYIHSPTWYRNFLYTEERARGLDYLEDLASPGLFEWDLQQGIASLIYFAEGFGDISREQDDIAEIVEKLRAQELQRRTAFSSPLVAAAESYLVKRGSGKTIIAGYPWFRDTFISLRGLCLATGRLDTAREILIEWAETVSMGMLPNRFPDRDVEPEYNSVDASLWYIIAVFEYLRISQGKPNPEDDKVRVKLQQAIDAILSGYSAGTRFRIKVDEDGSLAAANQGSNSHGWTQRWVARLLRRGLGNRSKCSRSG